MPEKFEKTPRSVLLSQALSEAAKKQPIKRERALELADENYEAAKDQHSRLQWLLFIAAALTVVAGALTIVLIVVGHPQTAAAITTGLGTFVGGASFAFVKAVERQAKEDKDEAFRLYERLDPPLRAVDEPDARDGDGDAKAA
jgi:hypothetical protein